MISKHKKVTKKSKIKFKIFKIFKFKRSTISTSVVREAKANEEPKKFGLSFIVMGLWILFAQIEALQNLMSSQQFCELVPVFLVFLLHILEFILTGIA